MKHAKKHQKRHFSHHLNPKNKDNGHSSCCDSNAPSKRPKGILQGIMYGLIPHIGCIAFIIGSVLGVTVLMNLFRPLLASRHFFTGLMVVSFLFATLSLMLYLKKNSSLSWDGFRRKWRYAAWMYGSTIAVNLILFMLVFPLLANLGSTTSTTPLLQGPGAGSKLTLKVAIPCPGHAPLISNDLKAVQGVTNVRFSFPNIFEVSYAGNMKSRILGLEIFKEYKATVISEESFDSGASSSAAAQTAAGGCGGSCSSGSSDGCGTGGGCGSSSGGCGCGKI